jgi:hypothetical protein
VGSNPDCYPLYFIHCKFDLKTMIKIDSKADSASLFFIVLMILIPLFGCNQSSDHRTSRDLFSKEPFTEEEIQFENLQLDTLRLDQIESSYVGFLIVSNDSIRFIDQRFGWIFTFDSEGTFYDRNLGQGHGPKELPMAGIEFYNSTPDGGHIFIGSSSDYYVFDQNYERIHQGVIRWKQGVPIEELARNPDPSQQRSYNIGYDIGSIMVTPTGNLYIPLISAPPIYSEFNFTTDLFAEKARILAKMDIETGQIETISGRLSPVFVENENIRTFSYFHYTLIGDSTLAITYLPDSLIYIADLDFNVLSAFGYSGQQMDLNYRLFPSSNHVETLRRFFLEEFRDRGYYTSLTYIGERELLFRGYAKGQNSTTDGLQVYRGNTLIADVEVPKIKDHSGDLIPTNHFKVIGYIDPWFYSNAVIDEIAEEIIVYRFRIDEQANL